MVKDQKHKKLLAAAADGRLSPGSCPRQVSQNDTDAKTERHRVQLMFAALERRHQRACIKKNRLPAHHWSRDS